MAISQDCREILEFAQDGACLLCPVPLRFYDVHHIIADDDKGPDHILNLVALCPNCHRVVETVRRCVAPRTSTEWPIRGRAALEYMNDLSSSKRTWFNILSEPHPLRKQIQTEIPEHLRQQFAHDLAIEDAKLLLRFHAAFPNIFWTWKGDTQPAITARELAEVAQLHLYRVSPNLVFDPIWLESIG